MNGGRRYTDLDEREVSKRHACRRFRERFDWNFRNYRYDLILEEIVAGKHPVVGHDPMQNSLHEIAYNGRSVYAVFDPKQKIIRTFVETVPSQVRSAAAGETALAAKLRAAGFAP